uniref:Secreted protein n=1 Tax=Arundo donax TaxID=35708 RepID=A0A0A9E1T5_ARUDO
MFWLLSCLIFSSSTANSTPCSTSLSSRYSSSITFAFTATSPFDFLRFSKAAFTLSLSILFIATIMDDDVLGASLPLRIRSLVSMELSCDQTHNWIWNTDVLAWIFCHCVNFPYQHQIYLHSGCSFLCCHHGHHCHFEAFCSQKFAYLDLCARRHGELEQLLRK